LLLTYKENVHSTQMYIPLKPLFSRHKGIGVQFTDEPTGNLDGINKRIVLDILRKEHEKGRAIVVITHDDETANAADKKYILENGKLL